MDKIGKCNIIRDIKKKWPNDLNFMEKGLLLKQGNKGKKGMLLKKGKKRLFFI